MSDDGFTDPNPAPSDDDSSTEDDDPWDRVADEDELKRRAQQDATADDPNPEDTPTEQDSESERDGSDSEDSDSHDVWDIEEDQPPQQPTSDDFDVGFYGEDEDSDWEGDIEIHADVSCENCIHRQVCIILSSFSPRLEDQNWDAGMDDEGSPIDPMDLAKVCDKYEPGEGEEAEAKTDA